MHLLTQVKNEEDDEDWGIDINEDAVAERMKEQTDAIQRLTMNDDLEKTANERMNLFYDFLKVYRINYSNFQIISFLHCGT